MNDQTAAAATLHDLALDHTTPQSIRLDPIPQVEGFKPDAAGTAVATGTTAVVSATSFLSMEEAEGKHAAILEKLRKAVTARGKYGLSCVQARV